MVELDSEIREEAKVQTQGNGKSAMSIEGLLHKGQEIIVQIKKEAISTKGPRNYGRAIARRSVYGARARWR